MIEAIRALILVCLEAHGHCRVLKAESHHGAFTGHVVARSAEVTGLEMSSDGAAQRWKHLRQCGAVTVDERDANTVFRTEAQAVGRLATA